MDSKEIVYYQRIYCFYGREMVCVKNGFYTPTVEELEKERIEQEELDEIRKWAYASYIEHYEGFGDRL